MSDCCLAWIGDPCIGDLFPIAQAINDWCAGPGDDAMGCDGWLYPGAIPLIIIACCQLNTFFSVHDFLHRIIAAEGEYFLGSSAGQLINFLNIHISRFEIIRDRIRDTKQGPGIRAIGK